MVAVRLSRPQIAELESALVDLCTQNGYSDSYVFHHTHCKANVRSEFLTAVSRIEFDAWGLTIDKANRWRETFRPSDFGEQRLIDSLIELLGFLPPARNNRTSLLLDIPKSENRRVQQWGQAVRQWHRSCGIETFVRVKSQTDTGRGGRIIQLADMLAGALNLEMRGELVLTERLRTRIHVIN